MKNIVLIGFMGTGKTTVGRMLAERLGRTFVDCDDLIELSEGKSIPEIFAENGEAYFRRKEAEVIARVAGGSDQVIATGGGAVMNPDNMEALRRNGIVVGLTASEETIAGRVAKDRNRPLLAVPDRIETIRRLLAERMPVYRQAEIVIDTDRFDSPGAVAEEIIRRLAGLNLASSRRRVTVNLGERSYDIWIGPQILDELGERLRGLRINDPLLVVTNPKVGGLYLKAVETSLTAAGWRYRVAVVPDGEVYKSLDQAAKLYDAAVEAGLERRSAVLALGGGVIGDLAGFVAATYMRGVRLVQIPTTLLAQVDSAVGGKVAVNHPAGKNLIGCFHQPCLVLADLETLRTLEPRDFSSGLAEVVKSAAIRDERLFGFLEAEREAIAARQADALAEAVEEVCRIKAGVTAEDEKEDGLRAILNFGHTVGHAIEAVTEYLAFRHGEAVAMGMIAAAEIGREMGLCPPEAGERLSELLKGFGLPVRLPGLSVEKLMAALQKDKKVSRGVPGFVLLRAIGRAEWGCTVPDELLKNVLIRLGAVV